MKRLFFAALCLIVSPLGRGACEIQRLAWVTRVCDLDAEKPATGNKPGDHVWAKDTSKLYYWDGAAWLNIGSGGGGGAPTTATYITQTPDATLSAEQAMSALGSGLELNTTGTGVQSIYAGSACAGTDKAVSISASGVVTCSAVAYANVTGTPTIPSVTGTGFWHETAGALDAASKLVNLTAATDVAANQGTTVTVFHGNAVGQGAFGPVVDADITGMATTKLTGTITDAQLANNYSGVGTCTNQFARVLNDNAAPTCSSVGSTDITDGTVAYADIQNIAGLSVMGRSANSSGVGADVTGTAGQVLRVSSVPALGFGTIDLTNLATTGGAIAQGTLLIGNSSDNGWTTTILAACPSGYLLYNGSSFACGTASTLLDTLGSVRGSILERGASGWQVILPGPRGAVLASSGAGADPAWVGLPLKKPTCNAVRRRNAFGTNCS